MTKPHSDPSRVVHDQLGTQSVVNGIHENHRQLDERAFYPAHDARKESVDYAKVHKELCIEKDLPCLVCGVRHSTLNNPTDNPYGATAMETHHHVIEWALANAIDTERFNKSLRPNLAYRHKDQPVYQRDMTEQEIRAWVDHSPDNLWVLCDVHHRHKFLGIHEISYPIWAVQDLLTPKFAEFVKKQLMGDGNAQ